MLEQCIQNPKIRKIEPKNSFVLLCLFVCFVCSPFYAHIKVVANCLVVNFLVFLVIARYPCGRCLLKSEEKLRTGLPDLPKPLRTNILLRKP